MIKIVNPNDYFAQVKIPACIFTVKSLTCLDKLLYGALAVHFGNDQQCYPRQKTLAKELGVSRDEIKHSVMRLKRAGLIITIPAPPNEERSAKINNYSFPYHECYAKAKKNKNKRHKENMYSPDNNQDFSQECITKSEQIGAYDTPLWCQYAHQTIPGNPTESLEKSTIFGGLNYNETEGQNLRPVYCDSITEKTVPESEERNLNTSSLRSEDLGLRSSQTSFDSAQLKNFPFFDKEHLSLFPNLPYQETNMNPPTDLNRNGSQTRIIPTNGTSPNSPTGNKDGSPKPPIRKLMRGCISPTVSGNDSIAPAATNNLVCEKDTDTTTTDSGELHTKYQQLLLQQGSLVPPPSPPKSSHIPDKYLDIIRYWNETSCARKHRLPVNGDMPTETVRQSVSLIKKLLAGKAFEKTPSVIFTNLVTLDGIKKAIAKIPKMLENKLIPVSQKTYLKALSFPKFIYDDRANSSTFVKCTNGLVLDILNLDEPTRKTCELLIDAFKRYTPAKNDFTLYETEKFVMGARLLNKKIDELVTDKKITFGSPALRPDDMSLWAKWVMESLVEKFGKNLAPGNISSNYTYNVVLINFLEERNSLKKTQTVIYDAQLPFSIYDNPWKLNPY